MLRFFFPRSVQVCIYEYNIEHGRKRRRRGRRRRHRWQKRVCEQLSLVAVRDSAEGKKKTIIIIIFRVYLIIR